MRFVSAFMGGVVGSAVYQRATVSPNVVESKEPARAFNASEFRKFTLMNLYDESYNTKVLRFAYPEGDMKGGLVCASCIVVRFVDGDGK